MSLTLLEVVPGSVKLVVESSHEGFEKIEWLIQVGSLTEILGIPIESMYVDRASSKASLYHQLGAVNPELSIREIIGNSIELLIEGLPQSIITPEVQAKAVLSLVQYGIPMTSSFSAGVIGGVGNATLTIGSQIHRIKFTFIALRSITALEVYSEAIDWIKYKKARGIWDAELSDTTIDYLREDLKWKSQNWLS